MKDKSAIPLSVRKKEELIYCWITYKKFILIKNDFTPIHHIYILKHYAYSLEKNCLISIAILHVKKNNFTKKKIS